MNYSRQLLSLAIPGLLVAIFFGAFLGHRSDYQGHFAAGLGGTLGATALALAVLPDALYARWSGPAVLGVNLVCIGIGAVTESTLFRLARFDELDFCNQSLGAVVASLSWMAAGERKPSPGMIAYGTLLALAGLMAGFHYAFAT